MIVFPWTSTILQIVPSVISSSLEDFVVQTTPFFAFASPFSNLVTFFVIKTYSPQSVFTYVFSLTFLNFLTAKGLVKMISKTVKITKISNCHLKGNPVNAMKIIGKAAIPAQIVVSPMVNASIVQQAINTISQNHGKLLVINSKIKIV